MAQVTINIPDAVLPRVVAAFGTQAALKASIIAHIKGRVAHTEQMTAVASIDSDIEGALGIS